MLFIMVKQEYEKWLWNLIWFLFLIILLMYWWYYLINFIYWFIWIENREIKIFINYWLFIFIWIIIAISTKTKK
jgi:hypothetical protein